MTRVFSNKLRSLDMLSGLVQGFNHFDGEMKNNEQHLFSIHSAELELLVFSNTSGLELN